MRVIRSLIHDERGLTNLEKLGVFSVIFVMVAFIPPFRGLIDDLYTSIFRNSVFMKGILITVVAVVAFIGSGYMILYTDLGKRLALLVTGAATFGWLTIGGMLFVVYAPRGLRPDNLEGLNSFQMRIPSIGLTLASFILFLMFVVALDRYEKATQ